MAEDVNESPEDDYKTIKLGLRSILLDPDAMLPESIFHSTNLS